MTKKLSQHTRDMEKMTGVSNLQRGKPRPAEVSVRAWAGIVEEKIHEEKVGDFDYRVLAIFPTRSEARRCYECVVPVRIVLDKERKR